MEAKGQPTDPQLMLIPVTTILVIATAVEVVAVVVVVVVVVEVRCRWVCWDCLASPSSRAKRLDAKT